MLWQWSCVVLFEPGSEDDWYHQVRISPIRHEQRAYLLHSPTTQAGINGGLTIWAFLVSLGCAFLVERVGRRFLFLGAGLGMLSTFTIWTALSAQYEKTGSSGAGIGVLAMIFAFYGFAGLAWPGLTVSYTVEILPYKIRAKGLTICFIFTSLSGVFNQYVNPIGIQNLAWKFYFVYIAILVVECLCIYFLYVETRGPTVCSSQE
jgi:hypothetical protein